MKMNGGNGFIEVGNTDFCDKLVKDESFALNIGQEIQVYAFTEEQAEAISQRCKWKTIIQKLDGQYSIVVVGGWRKKELKEAKA